MTTQSMRTDASGRFVFRLDPAMHAELRAEAERGGVSLNSHCVGKLGAPQGVTPLELIPAVARATRQFGEGLVAVIAYGSWARGEARSDSDIDLLIVLRSEVRLQRSLYVEWDDSPLHAFCLRVEPSIVNLPDADEPISGLWADVSLDGIVLLDRELVVSRHLAAVRRQIESGAISRRTAQGQPYWVVATPDA